MTISYDELMDYGSAVIDSLRKSMTLSINNEFDWEGIQVKISLPSNYDPNQTYPAILLNDGNLDFLSSLSESVILVGLTSKIALDDYTPMEVSCS